MRGSFSPSLNPHRSLQAAAAMAATGFQVVHKSDGGSGPGGAGDEAPRHSSPSALLPKDHTAGYPFVSTA